MSKRKANSGSDPKVRRGARSKLREFFLDNVGTILNADQLRRASGGINEWGRRIRELKSEEGYQILTNNDDAKLKPGQYLLISSNPIPSMERRISSSTRAFVLDRDGYTCQMCGAMAGEADTQAPGRKVKLQMGHVIDKSHGGGDTADNLRALCVRCNQGASNSTLTRPSWITLVTQVRRSTVADQLRLLAWLQSKFKTEN